MTARDMARALSVAVPPALVAAWLVLRGGDVPRPWLALGVAMAASVALAASHRVVLRRRLHTVASVLSAYREGDFSIRARTAVGGDAPLASVLHELNELGDTLRQHRLGELEAWALLRKVLSEVDVVVLAFDHERRVRLANETAARLLGRAVATLAGCEAAELGVAELLGGDAPRVVRTTALGAGPWELRRGTFRLTGEPHTLVVLSDVASTLRENERDAWRRLIRVLGHEINNSLTPIRSMSEGLLAQLGGAFRSETFESDLKEALGVISRRSEGLSRFLASYARLAKLPRPTIRPVPVAPLVEKVALLERRVAVEVRHAPDVMVAADADQIEQALINLVKNAAEASLATGGRPVVVSWTADERVVQLTVDDEGPGIAETANLFVPFFTTKPDGSGIGLVLARDIVEAHKGELELVPRAPETGTRARMRLPRSPT